MYVVLTDFVSVRIVPANLYFLVNIVLKIFSLDHILLCGFCYTSSARFDEKKN